ncbi:MAG: hypothetical protein ACREQ9_08800 [Candidatus Binatia bacterium]
MTLLTAHKILISTAIALFIFYAGFETRRGIGGDGAAWMRAAASAAGAVGFAIYLRSVFRAGRI